MASPFCPHAKNEPLSPLMRENLLLFAGGPTHTSSGKLTRRYIYDSARIVTTKYSGKL
jgi:hypothetical protein